jgi:hypothetical protein
MARVGLLVAQSPRAQPQNVVDALGQPISVPLLRVFGMVRIGQRARYTWDCIIDIAAPLTLFPWVHWQNFASDVEWLTPVGASAQSWLTNVSGRTGGNCLCRVGRVEVTALDVRRPRRGLAPVSVIAQFEQDPNGDDRILIGLHASILQRRRLHVDPDLPEAWLEDR